jgi:hypothetical protein
MALVREKEIAERRRVSRLALSPMPLQNVQGEGAGVRMDDHCRQPHPKHKPNHKRKRKPSQSQAAKAERRRQQAAQRAARDHPDRVLTFRLWCSVNNFSLATGRRILKGEKGPKPPVVQLSPRRIGIRESDNAAWQATRVR